VLLKHAANCGCLNYHSKLGSTTLMDHQRVICVLTCMMITTIAGAVTLFPPEVAPVCSGDELELHLNGLSL
jgi:hypothetical protein